MPEMYERGQVVIPKWVRDSLKLVPGTRVAFSIEGGAVVMKPERAALAEFRRLAAEAKASDGDVARDIAETRTERRRGWLDVP